MINSIIGQKASSLFHATKRMGCYGVAGALWPGMVFAAIPEQVAEKPAHEAPVLPKGAEKVGNFYFVNGNRHYYDAAHAPTQPTVPRFVPSTNGVGGAVAPNGKGAHSTATQPYLFSLHYKPIEDAGKFLANQGVYFTGFNVGQYNGYAGGGYKKGSAYTNWALFGVNLDMNRIAGVKGAQMHIILNDVAGQGRSWDYSASDWSWLSTWGSHDGVMVREMTWDQELFNKHLYILAGRANPKGGEFEGSELYCMFATFLCSSPTTLTIDGSSPSFTSATWAARILVKPTASTYIKGGVYEVEPWLKQSNHNGWPGEDWGFGKSTGAFIPVEAGYHTDFTTDKYPRSYALGFTYDTSPYDDPLYNTQHQIYATAGGTPLEKRGRSTIYLQAQQMIWKPDANGTRGLIAFGAANFLTSGDGTAKDGFVGGLFDWGPFSSRPSDYAGVVVQSFLWNHKVTRSMNASLQSQGYNSKWPDSETMLEALYGFNLAPGVSLSPYFEYIWNPDQLAAAAPRPHITHAIQAGLTFTFELNPGLNIADLHRIRK